MRRVVTALSRVVASLERALELRNAAKCAARACGFFFFQRFASSSYAVERRARLSHSRSCVCSGTHRSRAARLRQAPGYEILENLRARRVRENTWSGSGGMTTRRVTRQGKTITSSGEARNAPDTRGDGFRGDKNIAYDRDDAMCRAKRDLSKSRLNDGDANDAACNRVTRGSDFSRFRLR